MVDPFKIDGPTCISFWWAKQEAEARATGDGRFFRNDRPSYAEMAKYASEQRDIFNPNEEAIACFCGD